MSKRHFLRKLHRGQSTPKVLLPASAYKKGVELHCRAMAQNLAVISVAAIKNNDYKTARSGIKAIRELLEFIEIALKKMEEADNQ